MFDRIKESVQKFSRKNVADKEAVEELVKDIQRDLIQADVDVSLVSDISDDIREKALEDEVPSGLTRKEHVLEIVYNQLEDLLGDEAEIEIEPQTILLAGLYGAGKCVAPDSKVQLSDGRRVAAEDLYSELKPSGVEELEDGERFEVKGLEVPSFNPETLEIEDKPVEYLWRLEKDEDLIKVGLNAGNEHSIEVTPEHPFFVLEDGEVVKKRANKLSTSDHIAVPRELDTGDEVDLQGLIKDSLTDDFHFKSEDLSRTVKQEIEAEYGTLKKGFIELDLDIKYPWFTRLLSEKNEVPVEVARELELSTESVGKIVHRNSNSTELNIPEDEKGFLEFLGLLLADGYINERYLELNSGDEELIDRWQELSQTLFGLKASRNQDKRSESLEYSRISSKALVELVCNILNCEPGAKSGSISLPNELLRFESEKFTGFLRAYFDSDGHAQEGRYVEIDTKSEEMASQLRTLLLRNSIFSSKSSREIENSKYYRVTISGRDATKFAEEIGSKLERKQERLENYREIQKFQGSGSSEMIPVGAELQKQRLKTCTSISEIQEKVSSYGRYEKKGSISRKALYEAVKILGEESRARKVMQIAEGNTRNQILEKTGFTTSEFNGVISGLKKHGKLRENGNGTYKVTEESEQADIDQLEKLSTSDVNWVKVSSLERTQEHEYVYDLTVKDNHSFISENTIVHNTTTAGKLADFYRKRGLKPGLIAADTDRPAAYNQLKQIAEDVDVEFYGEEDAEDPVKVVENGKQALNVDVLIVDSAGRDSLNEELSEELSQMEEALQPDEKYLVMPADIGQSAREQAEQFEEAIGITGVIVTKMDSSAKGGGALVACEHSGAQVQFVGTGEQMQDLEPYDPVDFVSQMIGQPDLESLLEKIEEMDTDPEALLEGDFTLEDFQDQMSQVTDTGMMEEMFQQLPIGGSQIPDNISNMTEEKIQSYSTIMNSMTDEEKKDPSIIKRGRIERIAEGSGKTEREVRDLLKHYRQTKNMMDKFDKKSLKRGNMQDMMQNLGF
ncbi:MAG: LAGLIDADG family homing endonuclease [Candidatus Nanohaloarchaea archaeon]